MASSKDFLSKYVKASAKKARPVVQKSNSWLGNALRSVGYSAFDVLEELMPATIDVAKVTATTGKDVAEGIRKARTTDRTLRTAMERNYYVGLGTKVLKNSLDDLKSGKFYNKERADQFFNDMGGDDGLDFGEDFDFGEDDFDSSISSSDGMSEASFRRRKGGESESTQIVVNTNLGPDSAIVQATNYQTETSISVGRAVIDSSKVNTRATMVMIGGLRNEINASLSAINENVSTIATSITDVVSKQATLSAKYYEDSISLQTQILAELQKQTAGTQLQPGGTNTRVFKDYNNVMDLFSSGGGIDPKGYLELVKKQFGQYVDSNMILSQIKFMGENKETLEMMAQNPLAFIPKAITKTLIPNTVRSIITEFDNQLKETGIAALNQISGLQRSNNPLLSAIGKIFGLQNKITISSVDKSAYNKGAVAWAGTDHQALTNVIPTLLRKIHASISGSEEIGFDYERGVFAKVRDIEKQAEKDKMYRETSGYSEYKSEFKEFLEKTTATSREEREAFSQQFERFISALVRDSAGGRTFRKGGRDGKGDQDDIADLLGMNSDDPAVKLIRGYLSGMEQDNKAKLTAFFGSKIQEQRASIDRQMREIQADPVKYSAMYLDTGLQTYKDANKKNNYTGTDSHLQYRTARDVTGKSHITDYVTGSKLGGIGAGVVDKYGKNQTYYLREILQTLTAGIYVIPIGGMSGGTGGTADAALQTAIAERQTKVSDALKTHVKEAKEREKQQTHVSSYDNTKRQKDVDKGKIDTTGEFTQDQITLAGQMYQSEVNAPSPEKASFMDKIMGKVPEDSGLGRIFKRWKQVTDKSEKGLTTVFKKMDSALFEIVFGDPSGQHGFKAMFDKGLGVLKAGFFKFSTFLDNKILKPLDEALFGESGVFNKIKQSEFGQKVSEVFKTVMGKAETFLLGEKDGDGNRSGGLFSETANSLKDMGTNVKHAILGEKGPDGKPLPLDQDNSVMGNLKRMFKNTSESISTAIGLDPNRPKETLGTKVANGLDSAFNRIQERASDWSDSIFGQNPGGSEFLKQFKDDMKGQKGFIGASAVVGGVGGLVLGGHMGLLGSMFLPGGPIGGAILGAGIGIVSKSTGLKNFLFGPEETDAEGNVSRAGGVITKDFQKFFKDNKVGIGVGAGAGLAASIGLLPSFFVPGGPIGGALIGGALSLATKSEAFQELLYGEGGSKDNATGGIMKKFKEIFGKDKDFKKVGIDAGIGAGVGLVGSFFLPGGPLLGALLGSAISVGTATDKFRDWFFGKAGEDGKREGGIFNKFTGYMKEKIFTPLGTAVKIAQNNILGFVKSEMVAPFKWALKPLIKEAQYAKTVVTDSIKGVFNSVKEQFQRHVTRPIGEAVEKHLINPMKQALNKLFSGFGKLIGNILAAPFKLITGLGKGAYARQGKRDQDARDTEIKNQYEQKRSEILGDESQMGFFRKIGNRIKNVGKLGKAASDRDRALRASNQQRKDEYQGHIDELEAEQARIRHETELKNAALRSGTKLDTDSEGRVAGIPLSVFSQRTGIGRNTLKNMIKRGQLPAVKHGSNWIISPDLVSRFKRGKISTPKPETAPSTGGTDTTTTSQTTTTTQQQPGTPIPPTDTSAPAPTPTQETSGGKKRRRGRQSTVSTDAGSTRGAGTPPITGGGSSVNTTSGYKPESGESSVSPEGDSRKGKTYNMGSMTDRIQKDVSKIADSVWGQLNGVGSNINKIYKVLLKKLGLKDEDIQGENNKSYMGLFGRLRTAMNRPLRAIEDLITAPFRAVGRVVTNIKNGFLNIGKGIGKAGKALISGIGSIGKGLLGILGDIVKIPIDLLHTGLSAVRAALPAIGEAVKAGVSVIGTGLKTAGTLLYDGVKGIGSAISGAAKGFGQMVGGAMSGVGSLLKSLGLIGGDVLKGIWKGMKFVGAKGLQLAGTVASAPIKLFQSLRDRRREGGGGILGRKGPIHVIVDSGVLDKVKRINVVEHIKDIEIGTPITAESQGTGILGAIQRRMAAFGQDDSGGQGGGGGGKPLKPARRMPLPGGRGFLGTAASMVLQGASKIGSGIKKVGETAGRVKTAVSDRFQKMKEIAEEDKFRDARKAEQVKKGSRAELLKRFDAEQEKKETRIYRGKVVSLLGQSAAAGEEHKDLFSGIFGKKGLITAGILLLMPIFIKLFKNLKLGELLKDLADTVVTGWSEIGGIKGLIANLGEKTDQVTDVINNTDTHAKVDENGNLVTDENGNPVMETTKNKGFFGRIRQALMPTKPRVDVETGKWENVNEWTQMSGATAKLAVKKSNDLVKKGLKLLPKSAQGKSIYEMGKSVVGGVKGIATKGQKILNNGRLYNKFMVSGNEAMVAKAANSKISTKVAGKAISAVDNLASTSGGKVIKQFITKAREGIEFLVGKLAALGEKFGGKISTSKFGTFTKKIYDILDEKVLSKFAPKITNFFKKISVKTLTAVVDWGFAIYGAIDGAANAGALFEVNPDAVDAKMRAISAVFKGLMSTLVGSIVDFVNSLVYEILGMNFIKDIASWTYKLLSDDEDSQALEAAQKDFTQGYEDYVSQEYEAYKRGQDAKGEASISFEDFKASNMATSRIDYNSRVNKSLFRRAIDGAKNIKKLPGAIADGAKKLGTHVVGAAKGVKNFFVGSKEDILKKEDGSYYVATKNGYNYYGADGKLIYEDVSADSIDAMKERGELTEDTKVTQSGIGKIKDKFMGTKVGQGVSKVVGKAKETFGKVGDAVGSLATQGVDAAKGLGTGWAQIAANFFNKDNNFADYFKSNVNTVAEDNMFHGVVGGILNVSKVIMFPKLLVAGILKKVGTAIADVAKQGIGAAKGLGTGWVQISQNFFNKDNNFMDYFKADVNTVGEDNMFHGVVGGILNVSKVVMFPKLLVAGILKKVGTAILGVVKQGPEAAKGLLTGWGQISQNFFNKDNNFMDYFKADVNTVGEENIFHGVVGGILNVSKVVMFPKLLMAGIIKKIGTTIAGAVKQGPEAAKGLMTGWGQIAQNFYNKDNNFMDYFKADVNTVGEENMFHGVVGGILNVSKVIMFPKLLVAGILKKVGTAIADAVVKIFNGAKVAIGDLNSNTAELNRLAFAGDTEGLGQFKSQVSDDNPIGGVVSGFLGISRIVHYPIAIAVKVGKKIAETIKNTVSTVVSTAQAIGTNTVAIGKLAISGDVDGLHNYAGLDESSSPVAGFANGILGVEKVLVSPIAYAVKAGKSVVSTVKNAVTTVVQTGQAIGTNTVAIGQLAIAGDMEGVQAYEGLDENSSPVAPFANAILGVEKVVATPIAFAVQTGKKVVGVVKNAISTVITTGQTLATGTGELGSLAFSGDVEGLHNYAELDESSNPVAPFANAILGAEKTVLSPIAYVISTGKKLVGAVKSGIGKAIDYGEKTKSFVSTLNTYTDPDKSLSGWDSETMAEGDDPIGNILSTIVKKVMWIYVGIVRNIKGMFDKVKDVATDVVDGVKEKASGAWNWVKDKANSVGTAVMNLGRGGEAGGRPLAGGRGLPQETEVINGMPYFSQNDPKYKNMPYKQTGGYGSPVSDTIGDSGCGPTAMAMVASRFSGEGYTPPVMSKMAEAGGYSTSVGTSPEYFSAAGNALGIPNQQVAPTKESLENSLANGDSVVLQGISGGRGGEAGVNSPYTNEGHYVTATGLSGDRVLINDPRGPEYSGEYRTKDVIHDTTGMWSFGPGSVGGFGERVRNKYKGLKKALPGGKGGMSWLEVVQDVKKQIANYGRGYVYGGNVEKITSNGFTINHRTDCSGFVSICLSCYAGKNISVTSNTLLNAQPAISAAGFTKMSWPGWDNLKQGDIMSRSGHTEIFCKNENGKHYVWNCGSNDSCNNPGPTGTGHSQGYTVIWRCNNPGVASDVAINQAANTSGGDYSGGSYDSGGSTASASSGGFSSFTELLGGLANAAATPFLKAFGLKTDDSSSGGGSYSGGDYSGGYDSGGVSSSTGTGSAVSNLTGNSDTEKIWNHLTKTTGLDKFATAGFMGCWEEESHNSPHTVEGNYLSGYKNMGGESTVLANNANLNKYTTSVLFPAYQKSGIKINQSAYKGSDGNYYPGFGLAQWTGPRGQALFDWSKQQGVDWRELGTQLGYVDYELKNNKRGTPATYNGTSSVEDGLWKAMKIYEGNQSQTYYNKRLPHARKYYQLYAGGSGGEGGGRPLRSVTPIRQRKALPLPGGRGGNADILSVNSSLREAVTQSKDPTTRIVERNIINNGAESHDMAQLLKAGLEYLAQIVTNTGNMDKGITDLNDKEVKLINQTNNTTNNVNNSRNSYGSGQNDEAVGDRSKYVMAKRVARGTVEV